MKARQARLELLYDNIDITTDLKPHLKSWTITDNLSGQADDLSVVLEDKEQIWMGDWMPDTGASLTAKVVRENWAEEGDADYLSFGKFEIDEIEMESPPSTVTINALSIPESTSLRGEEKSRAWEKTKLSIVSRDISHGAGLDLFYDTEDDPEFDRLEQAGETDSAFLMRVCNDAGLCLKVSDAQIIIFDEQKYEDNEATLTIEKGVTQLKSCKGQISLNGVYRACKVEYHDANKGTTIRYEFVPDSPPKTKRVLIVNERVTSVREAERLAKKRLRKANCNGTTFTLSMMGDIRFVAGLTVNLKGFGKFDGKYIITQAVHGQQGNYETKLSLRKCLEGY